METTNLPLIEMNKEQVVRILNFIDATKNEEAKQDIFCQLGNECFMLGHSTDWGMSFNNDHQKLFDEINIKGITPYWKKLEFNEDKTILYLTGKKVTGCVCSFGNSKTPPKSLCLYCCKTFQENLFGTVFNKKVRVEITESSILGGERCSTAIHLV
jgi:hypothetical protein